MEGGGWKEKRKIEDCVNRDTAGVGGEWRMRTRDGGVENESEG